jgi:hypothetical protein
VRYLGANATLFEESSAIRLQVAATPNKAARIKKTSLCFAEMTVAMTQQLRADA